MTNSQSTLSSPQFPSRPMLAYSCGIGVDYQKGPLTKNDAHCWLMDDTGVICDRSPMLPEWETFEPTCHYHIAPNSAELVKQACEEHEDWMKRGRLLPGWTDPQFATKPRVRHCYANAIEYQKRHTHLKLVVGSQGFRAKGSNDVFWEFG